MPKTKSPILRALDKGFAGKKYRMAKALGTDTANVYNWLGGAAVDPRFCIAIEVLGGGHVKAHELRPDIFPAPDKQLPVHPHSSDGSYPDVRNN